MNALRSDARPLAPAFGRALSGWRSADWRELQPRHDPLLRADPRRFAELVRSVAAYGIHMLDREGLILSWNQGAQSLTGFAEHEVVGQSFGVLFAEAAQRAGAPGRVLNLARAHHHCREEQLRRRRDGGEFLAETTLDALRAEDGEILGYVEVFHDVTEQRRREDRLYQRATRDTLTGAWSRDHFTELATQEIERARRYAEPLSLVLLDIDHFKRVNDQHGHAAGDRVLAAVAQACLAELRRIDSVGRIGGEEFALLLPRANKEPALEMAQRLRLRIAGQRLALAGHALGVTASLGVAALRPQTRDLAELLRNADAALYRAKREGRNRVEAWFE